MTTLAEMLQGTVSTSDIMAQMPPSDNRMWPRFPPFSTPMQTQTLGGSPMPVAPMVSNPGEDIRGALGRGLAGMSEMPMSGAVGMNFIGPRLPAPMKGAPPTLAPSAPSTKGGLTLGEPFFRDNHFAYTITRDGEWVGSAVGSIDGSTAKFQFLGDPHGNAVNTLGVAGLRELREQFRRYHPEVTEFTGLRDSGAGPGRTQHTRMKGGDGSPRIPGLSDLLQQQ